MGYPTRKFGHHSSYRISDDVLPSPRLLQEYEYAADGAAERILAMAREEQQRRLAREESQLLFYKKTVRIGQFFGFLGFLAIVFLVSQLNNQGYQGMAITLFFGTLIVSFLTSVAFAYINRSPHASEPSTNNTKPEPQQADVASLQRHHSPRPQHNTRSSDAPQHRRSAENGRSNHHHRSRRRRRRPNPS